MDTSILVLLLVGRAARLRAGHPNLFMKNYIYNTQELGNPYHEQNTLLDNRFLNGWLSRKLAFFSVDAPPQVAQARNMSIGVG